MILPQSMTLSGFTFSELFSHTRLDRTRVVRNSIFPFRILGTLMNSFSFGRHLLWGIFGQTRFRHN